MAMFWPKNREKRKKIVNFWEKKIQKLSLPIFLCHFLVLPENYNTILFIEKWQFFDQKTEKKEKKWSIFEKKNKKIVMAHFPLPFSGTTWKLHYNFIHWKMSIFWPKNREKSKKMVNFWEKKKSKNCHGPFSFVIC